MKKEKDSRAAAASCLTPMFHPMLKRRVTKQYKDYKLVSGRYRAISSPIAETYN